MWGLECWRVFLSVWTPPLVFSSLCMLVRRIGSLSTFLPLCCLLLNTRFTVGQWGNSQCIEARQSAWALFWVSQLGLGFLSVPAPPPPHPMAAKLCLVYVVYLWKQRVSCPFSSSRRLLLCISSESKVLKVGGFCFTVSEARDFFFYISARSNGSLPGYSGWKEEYLTLSLEASEFYFYLSPRGLGGKNFCYLNPVT